MAKNEIILWEHQKKGVCEYYGCSDLHGNQYPDCVWENDKMGIEPPKACHLHQIHHLIDKLNEPCEEVKEEEEQEQPFMDKETAGDMKYHALKDEDLLDRFGRRKQ